VNPNPFIKELLSIFVANEVGFLTLAAYGELFIGFSMLFGIFTRLSGLSSTVMLFTYLLSYGFLNSSVFGINLWGALIGFDLAMNRSGRFFGLDQLLGPHLEISSNSILRALALVLT
jgi:uncharacterized membrane protein YphA (DoxX/SURF4 family)